MKQSGKSLNSKFNQETLDSSFLASGKRLTWTVLEISCPRTGKSLTITR